MTPLSLFSDADTVIAIDAAPFVRSTEIAVVPEFFEERISRQFSRQWSGS